MAAVDGASGGATEEGAAAGTAAGGAAAGAMSAKATRLELLVGGGEEQCTRGQKALPPRVFTILEPEKEKKGGGGA